MPRTISRAGVKWPLDGRTVGWNNVLPPTPPRPALHDDQRADWVVVGAGFTGLCCAWRLAQLRPGDRIVVIEALRVGEGNSGRNSGVLLDESPARDDQTNPAGRGRAHVQRLGLRILERLVQENAIDCQWVANGFTYLAMTPGEMPAIHKVAADYRRYGAEHEVWGPERLRDRFGLRHAAGALHYPGNVNVNPAALVRGLADHLPPNVTLYETSPLDRLIDDGDGWTLRSHSGSLRTPRVLICNNAFAGEVLGIRNRTVPVALVSSISRVLTDAELDLFGQGPFCVMGVLKGGSLFRRTADNRFYVRGPYTAYLPAKQGVEDHYETAIHRARESTRAHWPEFADVEFQHTWGGVLSMTRNLGQLFGQYGRGLFVSAYCNGGHNTRGAGSGWLLAEHALGLQNESVRHHLAIENPSWIPPRVLVGPYTRGVIRSARRAQAKAEREALAKQ